MGILELESKKKSKKRNIQKMILQTVALTGLVSVALLAPNVIGAMVKLGIIPHKRQTEIIKRSRQKLIEDGLLNYVDGFLRLTKEGEGLLKSLEIADFKITKPKKWDKKWRVLIFDIKETKSVLRNKIRRTLNAIGFVRLQNSVWIYPYDCEDLVVLLKSDFKIGKELLYMIVDELEYDAPIRKLFNLPRNI